MRHLKKSKRLQDAEAGQRLLDTAARADGFEAIRQGLEDVARGRTLTAREVLRRDPPQA
ncbi:hypothetical protein SBA6_710014 [Candidatus Sulfopaludibacter sp. SbA6]|nr:hypothetical protein SBA6_710014 [Candidatus Sulfopaludibacter sp. SbA6]